MPTISAEVLYQAITNTKNHRRSQGVHWVHVHPQGGEKFLGPNLHGKVVSAPQAETAPLEAEQKFIFLGNWENLDGGRSYSGRFSVCFEGDD